jgi:hypothetical protein
MTSKIKNKQCNLKEKEEKNVCSFKEQHSTVTSGNQNQHNNQNILAQ